MHTHPTPFVAAASVLVALCAWCTAVPAQDGGGARACVPIADAAQRLACYDRAMQRPATAAAAAPAAPAGPAPAVSPADAAFGLPPVPRAPAAAGSMDSEISGAFDGWQPGTRWTLANGQVWGVVDGSSGAYPRRVNAKVRVTSGSFGSFFIEIEGVSQSPRVRRLQ